MRFTKTVTNKNIDMVQYSDLSAGSFYLLRDQPDASIQLVSVLALTDKCILLRSYGREDHDFWKKNDDPVAELIEELDYDSAAAILSVYNEEEDPDGDESF